MISESEEENEFVSGGPDWHMIIGGKNSSSVLKSVELFNWRTKEQESQTNLLQNPFFAWILNIGKEENLGCFCKEKNIFLF